MNTKLLAGASTLVLAMGLGLGPALAFENNDANYNGTTAVSQERSGDAVAGSTSAVEDGAIAGTNNAVGQDANNNALAAQSSTAVQIDGSSPVLDREEGRSRGGSQPLVDDGSSFNVGNYNEHANAFEESAATTGDKSPAITTFTSPYDGSSQVIGTGNSTATADKGGAAVGGSGTAIGISDVTIGPKQQGRGGGDGFSDPTGTSNVNQNAATNQDAQDQSLSLQQQQQEQNANAQSAAAASSNVYITTDSATVDGSKDGFGSGAGDDATVAFGIGNTVASAHLSQTVTGLAVAFASDPPDRGRDHKVGAATIKTGSIYNNSVSSMTGANRVVFNTGIANQGRALSVGANNSF